MSRILSSTETGSTGLVPSSAELNATQSSDTLTATGLCEGELAWRVNSEAAGVNLVLTAKDLHVLSQGANAAVPQTLWHEPSLTSNLQGTWFAESGALELSKVAIGTQWLNYQGTSKYATYASGIDMQFSGQAVYDAGILSNKLMPYTGGQLTMAGRKQVPVEILWKNDWASNGSMFAWLQPHPAGRDYSHPIAAAMLGSQNVEGSEFVP